jgi:hypothetical protein
MQVLTDENFKGYEFRCTTSSANVGFKHVCEVYKNNEPIDACLSVVNWGNRTWESYQYKTVFEESKAKLQNFINGIQKPEIDYDFLNTLANEGYIFDYGDMEDGTPVILMDGWYQVEGEDERTYNKETNRMEKTGNFKKSVYAKLVDLAEKGLLKPSINSTIKNVDYVFTDSYRKCDECGIVHSLDYGDLTWVEEEGMLLCDKCISSPDRVQSLIQDAQEDMRKALKPTVDQEIIKELGYSLIEGDTFSFAPDRYFVNNTTEEYIDRFIHKYNGFVQIYQVEQFDCPFQLWIPTDRLEDAQREIDFKFNR